MNVHSPCEIPDMNETRLPDASKLLGAGGRIAVHPRQRVLEPAHRIVHQRLVQPRHRAVADHALMHEVAGEIRLVAPEQPQHVIGRPAGMIHQTAAERSIAAASRRRPRAPLAIGVADLLRQRRLTRARRRRSTAPNRRSRATAQIPSARRSLRTDATPRARPCPARSAPSRRCCRRRPRCARRRTQACRDSPRCCRPRSG